MHWSQKQLEMIVDFANSGRWPCYVDYDPRTLAIIIKHYNGTIREISTIWTYVYLIKPIRSMYTFVWFKIVQGI